MKPEAASLVYVACGYKDYLEPQPLEGLLLRLMLLLLLLLELKLLLLTL